MRSMFLAGGPLMWPILLCSLLSLTVVIERIAFWHRLRRAADPALRERLLAAAASGAFDEAAAAARGSRDPAVRVYAAGLAHRACGLSESMQTAADGEIARTRRGLAVLDTSVTLAPLLGILGTVSGIITSFDLIGGGVDDPKAVTGGIAVALITTAAGLTVAILALIPFNFFISRVESFARDLAGRVTQFEIACRRGREPGDASA